MSSTCSNFYTQVACRFPKPSANQHYETMPSSGESPTNDKLDRRIDDDCRIKTINTYGIYTNKTEYRGNPLSFFLLFEHRFYNKRVDEKGLHQTSLLKPKTFT